MTELSHTSHYEYGRIEPTADNVDRTMELTAIDLVDGGLTESVASDIIGIGVPARREDQTNRLRQNQELYLGAFSSDGLKAILKISQWTLDEQISYALNRAEAIKLRIQNMRGYTEVALGVQALVGARDIKRPIVVE